ncbi:MAG: NUDIX hydrolase [Candidatus Levybacteria bacterium]|nr:NUDIX hydrolase [Candidatus Levybacteria bacterium]
MIECVTLFDKKKLVPASAIYFRPAVYGVVVHNGKVLVIKMKSTGKYMFPGGGIEEDDIEDALRREMREEAGIEIDILHIIHFHENYFYYDPLDEAFNSYLYFYLCLPKTLSLAKPHEVDDLEAEDPQWISQDILSDQTIQGPEIGIHKIVKAMDLSKYETNKNSSS